MMFKGFQDKSKQFHGFPNLNFQMNNEAYGFSGCTFWLDAAYGLNTQTDLAAVSSWKDRISGINFEQATAGNQPRLVVADANFNNLPSIDFDVAAKVLVSSVGIGFGNHTIAFIAKVNVAQSANCIFSQNENASSNIYLGGTTAGITGIGVYNTATSLIGTPSIENTSTHIAAITTTEIVVDGVQNTTGNWIPGVSYNTIGRGTTTTSANLRGRVSEIIIFKRKLSSDELITLSTNINSKYAIY